MATEKLHRAVAMGQRTLKHALWLCGGLWVLMALVWLGGAKGLDADADDAASALRKALIVWSGLTVAWFGLWRWSLRRPEPALHVSTWICALLVLIWALSGALPFVAVTGYILFRVFRGYRAAVGLRKAGTFATLSPEVFD